MKRNIFDIKSEIVEEIAKIVVERFQSIGLSPQSQPKHTRTAGGGECPRIGSTQFKRRVMRQRHSHRHPQKFGHFGFDIAEEVEGEVSVIGVNPTYRQVCSLQVVDNSRHLVSNRRRQWHGNEQSPGCVLRILGRSWLFVPFAALGRRAASGRGCAFRHHACIVPPPRTMTGAVWHRLIVETRG